MKRTKVASFKWSPFCAVSAANLGHKSWHSNAQVHMEAILDLLGCPLRYQMSLFLCSFLLWSKWSRGFCGGITRVGSQGLDLDLLGCRCLDDTINVYTWDVNGIRRQRANGHNVFSL